MKAYQRLKNVATSDAYEKQRDLRRDLQRDLQRDIQRDIHTYKHRKIAEAAVERIDTKGVFQITRKQRGERGQSLDLIIEAKYGSTITNEMEKTSEMEKTLSATPHAICPAYTCRHQ